MSTPMPPDPSENLLILSDLHLNEGWLPERAAYSPREDFFYDAAFFDVLRHHHAVYEAADRARPWRLVLNGDTFDFEQVVALPSEGPELARVCGVATYDELGERARFGLETSAVEGRWKLRRIVRGHPGFFAALGWFVAQGHRVLLIKGNHDPELYWPEVQADLRHYVLRAYRAYRRERPAAPPLTAEDVAARVQFEPWFYYAPRHRVYIEHGNQYEPSNHFPRHLAPVDPADPASLELPDGMLMTRYVFNRLEESYPHADNVRPVTRVFGWILADSPLAGTRVFLARAGDLVRGWRHIWRRRQQRGAASLPDEDVGPLGAHGGLPARLVAEIQRVAQRRTAFSLATWGRLAVDQGLLGVLNLTGIAAVLWGMVQLMRPGRARKGARSLLAAFALLNSGHFWSAIVNDDRRLDYMPEVAADLAGCFQATGVPLRAVVLGHTHIARREWLAGRGVWMANTGAWMPTLVQHPHRWALHLTFVRVTDGAPELLAWDPEARTAHPFDLPGG